MVLFMPVPESIGILLLTLVTQYMNELAHQVVHVSPMEHGVDQSLHARVCKTVYCLYMCIVHNEGGNFIRQESQDLIERFACLILNSFPSSFGIILFPKSESFPSK